MAENNEVTKYEILFDLLAEHGWFIERGNRSRSSKDWNRPLWLVCEGGRNSGVIVGQGATPERAVEDAVRRQEPEGKIAYIL